MYVWTRTALGEPPRSIVSLRMRKDECPPQYEPRQKQDSQTKGFLKPDVSEADGRLLIADFAIEQPGIRSTTKNEKLLKEWLTTFERDKGLRFRILGFTDCLGHEKDNLNLRKARAQSVLGLLGRGARSRVVSVRPADAGTFVPGTDNRTKEGRATNRSVVIEFWRYIEAEKLIDEPKRPPPIDVGLPESTKERIRKEAEGPMETERRRREAAQKQWGLDPKPRKQSLIDQVRQKLREEGVPEGAIDQLFKKAELGGRLAAKAAVTGMSVSDATREFVTQALSEIFSWKF